MGVEPQECTGGDREKTRREWNVRGDEVVVGHLANQSREKGTIDLLQAAEQLWRQGKRFRLVLAGPEMGNFRSFWNGWRPSGCVIRLGRIEEAQKRDFFAGIDIFALPSRSDSFGLVLLEAWANGIPNVAYRAGGVAEVIHHEQDGLLVRCGDTAQLACSIGILVDDPVLRRRLGTRGQERVLREFRWDEKLSKVRQVYEEVRH